MANNPIFHSTSLLFDALNDEEVLGEDDNFSTLESASVVQPINENPSDDDSAEAARKLVISNLDEPFGNDEVKQKADWSFVFQLLCAIKVDDPRATVREVKREEQQYVHEGPRRLVVTFVDEQAAKRVLVCGQRMAAIPQFSHLSLAAYKTIADEDEATHEKRKILILDLAEPFGNEKTKEEADRNMVVQILCAIRADELGVTVQAVCREGPLNSNGEPRRVAVTFADEQAQRIVLDRFQQLTLIPQFSHLSLFEYTPMVNPNKQILLFDLAEPFGDAHQKEEADLNSVVQILCAIKADGLEESIEKLKRVGDFDPNGESRCVLITFNDENAQRIVLECAPQLESIPQLCHLSLCAPSFANDAKKKVVLDNLSEPFGNEQRKREADRSSVLQVLCTLEMGDFVGNIQEIKREGKVDQNGKPRQLVVTFVDENAPRLILEQAHRLATVRQFSHLSLHLYQLPNQKADTQKLTAETRRSTNTGTTGCLNRFEADDDSNSKNTPHKFKQPENGQQQNETNFNCKSSWPKVDCSFENAQSSSKEIPEENSNFEMIRKLFEEYQNSQKNNPPPFSSKKGEGYEKGIIEESECEIDDEEEEVETSTYESASENEAEEVVEEETEDLQMPTNRLFKDQAETYAGAKKNLNILVLGETGVGKSTWINGIANYLSFETLEDSLTAQQPVCLIPSKFDYYETNEKKTVVKFAPSHGKSDGNESFTEGQSSTQVPKTYQFETAKYIINIIDTPGIGDTRGVGQDKANASMILSAIGQYKELHALCFLLKANDARLTLDFRYRISEILLQLHKDAIDNLVFFFTKARGTFYKPGDTMGPLSTFLDELRNERGLRISLANDRIFCTDNEAFRLMCAHFSGAKITKEDFNKFSGSWTRSAAETYRFIEFTARQRPHKVADTISINEARAIIGKLAKPLADVNELIESNIAVTNDRKRDLQNTVDTLDDLKGKLMIPLIGIEAKPLEFPKTVCVAPHCTDTMILPGTEQFKTIYKQICHDHCYLDHVHVEIVPEPGLQQCAAMGGTPNCRVCKCSWESHMHIRFEQVKTSIQIEDINTKALIDQNQDVSVARESAIRECESKIDELKREQQKIIKTSLRFGSFLQANAILPYNDAFEKYVEQTISEEEKCTNVGGDRTKLESLRKLLEQYCQERLLLQEAQKDPVENGENTITADEIAVMQEELFELRHIGATLEQLFKATEDGLSRHQEYAVVKYAPPRRSRPLPFQEKKEEKSKKEMPTTSKKVPKAQSPPPSKKAEKKQKKVEKKQKKKL